MTDYAVTFRTLPDGKYVEERRHYIYGTAETQIWYEYIPSVDKSKFNLDAWGRIVDLKSPRPLTG